MNTVVFNAEKQTRAIHYLCQVAWFSNLAMESHLSGQDISPQKQYPLCRYLYHIFYLNKSKILFFSNFTICTFQPSEAVA